MTTTLGRIGCVRGEGTMFRVPAQDHPNAPLSRTSRLWALAMVLVQASCHATQGLAQSPADTARLGPSPPGVSAPVPPGPAGPGAVARPGPAATREVPEGVPL